LTSDLRQSKYKRLSMKAMSSNSFRSKR